MAAFGKQQQLLQDELKDLQSRVLDLNDKRPNDWMLAESEYLVRMAGRKLWLEHDIVSAITLLGNADERIKALNDPSLMPIRKALAGLIESGLLVQRQGAGTFVAERILRQFSRLTSFTDDLRERGLNPQVRFLERSVGEVTPEESMALNLSPGSGVVRMYRLRHVDGAPIAIERTLVPYALLPDPDSVTTSLYEALDAYGHRPKRALQRLRAVALDEEAARHLELPVGAPGLLVERRAFLEDGRVVESTRSYYRGDAYDFVAELQSD